MTPPALEVVLQDLHDFEIRCGIQNETPAGGITASIGYGSRTEKAIFYGTSSAIGRSGLRQIASRRGCTRPRCASSQITAMLKNTPVKRAARQVHPMDIHVGRRIRQRRRFLGKSMETLAKVVGVSFQQVQKYEIGFNGVSASRLFELCKPWTLRRRFFSRAVACAQKTFHSRSRP